MSEPFQHMVKSTVSPGGGSATGSPFWVTTGGYAGGTNQAAVNVNSVPGYNPQVLAETHGC